MDIFIYVVIPYALYLYIVYKFELFEDSSGFQIFIAYPISIVLIVGLSAIYFSNEISDRNERLEAIELQNLKEEEETQRLLNNKKNLQEFYDTYEYSGINQLDATVVILGSKNNDTLNIKYFEDKNNPRLLGELKVNFKNIISSVENKYDTDENELNNGIKFGYSLLFGYGNFIIDDDLFTIATIPYVPPFDDPDYEKIKIETIKEKLKKANINIKVLGYESAEELFETYDFGLFNTKICEMKTKTNESIISTIEPIFFYVNQWTVPKETTLIRSLDIYLDLDFNKMYIAMDSEIFPEMYWWDGYSGSIEQMFFSDQSLNKWNLEHIQLCDFNAITGLYPGS